MYFKIFITSSKKGNHFEFINIENANPFDLLINEIYADLSPAVDLPDGKFVEIYNRSDKYINLLDYQLADAVGSTFLPDFLMEPQSYVILCEDDLANVYAALGPTIGLASFPSPNITGDDLSFWNADGILIHQVSYEVDWYQDAIKQEGGWTLELINPSGFCLGEENWRASLDPSGGTPGKQNSVFEDIPDLSPPELLSVTALSEQEILLVFSELLAPDNISIAENYLAPATR